MLPMAVARSSSAPAGRLGPRKSVLRGGDDREGEGAILGENMCPILLQKTGFA